MKSGYCTLDFMSTASLAHLRHVGRDVAALAGLTSARADAVELAISELATNSLQHGGGRGRLDIWANGKSVVCVVTDAGHVDPGAGQRPPEPGATRGRGLWIVNQVCDEVERRTTPNGTTTRIVIRG